MACDQLLSRLRALRRRLLAAALSLSLMWAVVLSGLVFLACAWLDLVWELSSELRTSTLATAVAAGLCLFAALLLRQARKTRDTEIARSVDDAAGSGGEVLGGLELGQRLGSDLRDQQTLSTGLAELAVVRAQDLAANVPKWAVVPLRPLKIAAGTLVAMIIVVAVLVLCLPGLADTQWRRFSDPYADVPPYTRLKIDVDPGNASVVYGEELRLHANLTGPGADAVRRVELVMVNGDESDATSEEFVPMFPEAPGRWQAVLASVTSTGQYYVRARRARSRRYRVDVITVPRIEQVVFRIVPPEYTADPVYEGPLPQGGIAGLPGTRVHVTITSNRPLHGGQLAIETDNGASSVAMKPNVGAEHTVEGTFTITESGVMHCHVTDVAGQSSTDQFTATITMLHDSRPFVRMLSPRKVSLATPTSVIPVEISAEDDYGISSVQLFRSLNDSRARPLDFKIQQTAQRRLRDVEYLRIAPYDLDPGDRIKLFVRVEDNDPAGAKGAESPIATIQIISQEDYDRMLRRRQGLKVLMSKYRAAARHLENLARQIKEAHDEVKRLQRDGKPDQQARQRLAELRRQLRRASKQINSSADNELPLDLDRNLTEQLRQLARRLAAAAAALEKAENRDELNNGELADALKKIGDDLKQQGGQFQQGAMEPLEHLEKAFPLLADQATFVQIVARQIDLAKRLESIKGFEDRDDPALKARMRDLEEEQLQNRQALVDLLRDIEDHAARLPEIEAFDDLRTTALEFVETLRNSGATEAMSAAEVAMAEFQPTEAHKQAQRAADILRKLIKPSQGMGGAAGQSLVFNPTLAGGLGNTIAQLLGEMGLGTGMGMGGGGGYSARRNSLKNVGLYGASSALGEESGGSKTGVGEGGIVDGTDGGEAHNADPYAEDSPKLRSAVGGGTGNVPVQYRRRVGKYFERISDEALSDR